MTLFGTAWLCKRLTELSIECKRFSGLSYVFCPLTKSACVVLTCTRVVNHEIFVNESWVSSSNQNSIGDKVSWDNVCLKCSFSFDISENSKTYTKHDTTRGWNSVSPPLHGLIIATHNDRRSIDNNWDISSQFVKSSFSEGFGKSISVRPRSYDLLLIILEVLWVELLQSSNLLFWVINQVVDLFFNEARTVWVHISSGDMLKN